MFERNQKEKNLCDCCRFVLISQLPRLEHYYNRYDNVMSETRKKSNEIEQRNGEVNESLTNYK